MALGFIVLTRLSGSGLMVDCIRHESGLSLEPLAGTLLSHSYVVCMPLMCRHRGVGRLSVHIIYDYN